jgi:hypothetical protein
MMGYIYFLKDITVIGIGHKIVLLLLKTYDEFVTRSERNKMGGNMGIHLGVLS